MLEKQRANELLDLIDNIVGRYDRRLLNSEDAICAVMKLVWSEERALMKLKRNKKK